MQYWTIFLLLFEILIIVNGVVFVCGIEAKQENGMSQSEGKLMRGTVLRSNKGYRKRDVALYIYIYIAII